LLDENPDASDEEIKHCLKDTYCRCTGYAAIMGAVKAAGTRRCSTGVLPEPELPDHAEPLEHIGKAIPRPDADCKGHGQGDVYAMITPSPQMLHGATLRSASPMQGRISH
jgi:aldehyde oxidoreductase